MKKIAGFEWVLFGFDVFLTLLFFAYLFSPSEVGNELPAPCVVTGQQTNLELCTGSDLGTRFVQWNTGSFTSALLTVDYKNSYSSAATLYVQNAGLGANSCGSFSAWGSVSLPAASSYTFTFAGISAPPAGGYCVRFLITTPSGTGVVSIDSIGVVIHS